MAKVLKLNPHSINQHIQKKKVKKKVLGQKKKSLKLNREKSHQNKVINYNHNKKGKETVKGLKSSSKKKLKND